MIYGWFGLPAMEIAGMALATVFANGVGHDFNIFGVFDGHGTGGLFCPAFPDDGITKEITRYTGNFKNNDINNSKAVWDQLQ